jgi:flagellin
MRINTNVAALNTYGKLNAASQAGSKSMERLSSGLRINRAADDAAGLAISEKMRAQIRGLDQAQRNAQNGVSMIQTAEGAMDTQHSILQRMRELAVQSSNSTVTDADKQNIQEEMNQLIDEVDRIAKTTEFNNIKLINGDVSKTAKYATSAGGDLSSVIANSNATTGSATVTVAAVANAVGTGGTGAIWSTGQLQNWSTGSAVALTGGERNVNLTDLGNSAGNFGLEIGDEISLSATVGGEIKNVTYKVTADSDLDDLMATIRNAVGAKDVSISSGGPTDTSAVGLDGGTIAAGGLTIEGEAGAQYDISSLSIKAKSETGTSKSAFDTFINGGINQGLKEHQVAANEGDVMAKIDADGSNGNTKGDSIVAVRANATIQSSNLTLNFDDVLTGGGSTSTIKVGSRDQSAQIQIGANEGQQLNLSIESTTAESLGLRKDGVNISVMTSSSASESITKINDAINKVSSERAKLGAVQNRLEYTNTSLGNTAENMTTAESRIRDVDMAQEMMQFTKNNILAQAAQSMLAQANQQPQQVLQLLR